MWEWITLLGMPELGLLLIPVLGLLYLAGIRELKPYLKLYIPSILLFLLLVFFIKLLFPVPRPCIPCPGEGCNPICPSDPSFPSGHSGTAWIIWLPPLMLERRKRWLWVSAVPVLVCISRVALGVHTWLDVTGGAVLALAILFVFWRFFKPKTGIRQGKRKL